MGQAGKNMHPVDGKGKKRGVGIPVEESILLRREVDVKKGK